ncbi:MAG: hypothetical protein HY273_09615 [Gammaproteobacteria bacterium]|nr:hypothetical protein [Gammaproteobacteria bacterium]
MPCEQTICISYPDFTATPFPPSVLGAVSFGASEIHAAASLRVPLLTLGNDTPIELWSSALPVATAALNDLHYAHNGVALWGTLTRAVRDEASFESAVETLYEDVLSQTRRAGYPHLLRMWNYFPGIHIEYAGLDRYQRFCVGRQRAFDRHQLRNEREFPAATVIGTQSGDIALYFLAARTPGEPVENPRQLSAYRYPEQYGPASPAFSRSMLKRWDGVAHLYISGTASIVGHESRHQQLNNQLAEILHNLRALAAQATTHSGIDFSLEQRAHLKVYVRDINDASKLRTQLLTELPTTPALFLAGDICRRDLLLEIEALIWSGADA